jgi:heat shock protein HslJ
MKPLSFSVIIAILTILLCACAGYSLSGASNLDGATWLLTGYNHTHPLEGTQPTIQFEDGQVSGNAGCNHYGGSYQIRGDAISFGEISSTEMACQDPVGVMNQEQTYLDLLRSADRFALTDGVLTLFSGAHQILTFEME